MVTILGLSVCVIAACGCIACGTAGCSIIVEKTRITVDAAGRDLNPLNLAEVRLFSASKLQYKPTRLTITMSSFGDATGPQNCLDDDIRTTCETTSRTNQLEWLRVTYPCSEGLSRVEITNRVDCCQERIVQYQMRVTEGNQDITRASAYRFNAAQPSYTWFVGEWHVH